MTPKKTTKRTAKKATKKATKKRSPKRTPAVLAPVLQTKGEKRVKPLANVFDQLEDLLQELPEPIRDDAINMLLGPTSVSMQRLQALINFVNSQHFVITEMGKNAEPW
jgi:hypothetical protein